MQEVEGRKSSGCAAVPLEIFRWTSEGAAGDRRKKLRELLMEKKVSAKPDLDWKKAP